MMKPEKTTTSVDTHVQLNAKYSDYLRQMLTIQEIFAQLVDGIKQTSLLEFVAVISGIASVWFSRIENILVYPVGLINTIIYIFLSMNGHLFGEASVNFYYTVMSIYGWILWAKKDQQKKHVVV